MSDTLPVIRLEIENIRASVIRCLCDRHAELEQAVNEAFNGIDVDQLVRDVVFRTVKPEVERVVREAVEDAVKRGAVEALKSDAVWSVVNNTVFAQVNQLFDRSARI